MKYFYIVTLLMVLGGMFYFGERMPASPELTYSISPDKPLSATYTKDDYCAPEVDSETTKYRLELSAAYHQINTLRDELEKAKTGSESAVEKDDPSGTPTPTIPATLSPTLNQIGTTPSEPTKADNK